MKDEKPTPNQLLNITSDRPKPRRIVKFKELEELQSENVISTHGTTCGATIEDRGILRKRRFVTTTHLGFSFQEGDAILDTSTGIVITADAQIQEVSPKDSFGETENSLLVIRAGKPTRTLRYAIPESMEKSYHRVVDRRPAKRGELEDRAIVASKPMGELFETHAGVISTNRALDTLTETQYSESAITQIQRSLAQSGDGHNYLYSVTHNKQDRLVIAQPSTLANFLHDNNLDTKLIGKVDAFSFETLAQLLIGKAITAKMQKSTSEHPTSIAELKSTIKSLLHGIGIEFESPYSQWNLEIMDLQTATQAMNGKYGDGKAPTEVIERLNRAFTAPVRK